MIRGSIAALAALALAACQTAEPPADPPAPDSFALTYTSLTGDVSVLDYDLTMDDCLIAMDKAMDAYGRGIGCEIER